MSEEPKAKKQKLETPFLSLGNDVIRYIIKDFDVKERLRLERVCKRLQTILLRTPVPALNSLDLQLTKEKIARIGKRWTFRSISLLSEHLIALESSGPVLRELLLYSNNKDPIPIVHLNSFLGQSNLRFLKLSQQPDNNCPVIDLRPTLRKCPHLEAISLNYINFTENLHESLPKSIRGIEIRGTVPLSSRPFRAYPKLEVLKLFPFIQSEIHQLSVSELHIRQANDPFTSETKESPLSKSLKILHVTRGLPLNSIIWNFSQLQELYLINCQFMEQTNFRNLPKLRILQLLFVAVDDSDLESIGRHCKELEHVQIMHCLNTTSKGFEAMFAALFSGEPRQKLRIYGKSARIERIEKLPDQVEVVQNELFDFPQNRFLPQWTNF